MLSASLAAVGIVGLATGLSIVSRLPFYAFDEPPPERLAIRAAVMLSSAAVWSTAVLAADLRSVP